MLNKSWFRSLIWKNVWYMPENFLAYNLLKFQRKWSRNDGGNGHLRWACSFKFQPKVVRSRDCTQNEQKWHAFIYCHFWQWCICLNEKLRSRTRKRISSATTYWNLGENRPIFTELESNLHKFYDVIFKKMKFWV